MLKELHSLRTSHTSGSVVVRPSGLLGDSYSFMLPKTFIFPQSIVVMDLFYADSR